MPASPFAVAAPCAVFSATKREARKYAKNTLGACGVQSEFDAISASTAFACCKGREGRGARSTPAPMHLYPRWGVLDNAPLGTTDTPTRTDVKPRDTRNVSPSPIFIEIREMAPPLHLSSADPDISSLSENICAPLPHLSGRRASPGVTRISGAKPRGSPDAAPSPAPGLSFFLLSFPAFGPPAFSGVMRPVATELANLSWRSQMGSALHLRLSPQNVICRP